MDEVSVFLAGHPEISAAISFGLRQLTVTRPDNPVQYLAEQLKAFNARNKYGAAADKGRGVGWLGFGGHFECVVYL